MAAWTVGELEAIGGAFELRVATRRADGSLRRSVTTWIVRVGDDLFVRSVNGRGAAWFRGVQRRHEGRVAGGGLERDVAFQETDERSDEIDAAYRAKYRSSPGAVGHITRPAATAATLKLLPLGD